MISARAVRTEKDSRASNDSMKFLRGLTARGEMGANRFSTPSGGSIPPTSDYNEVLEK